MLMKGRIASRAVNARYWGPNNPFCCVHRSRESTCFFSEPDKDNPRNCPNYLEFPSLPKRNREESVSDIWRPNGSSGSNVSGDYEWRAMTSNQTRAERRARDGWLAVTSVGARDVTWPRLRHQPATAAENLSVSLQAYAIYGTIQSDKFITLRVRLIRG